MGDRIDEAEICLKIFTKMRKERQKTFKASGLRYGALMTAGTMITTDCLVELLANLDKKQWDEAIAEIVDQAIGFAMSEGSFK